MTNVIKENLSIQRYETESVWSMLSEGICLANTIKENLSSHPYQREPV